MVSRRGPLGVVPRGVTQDFPTSGVTRRDTPGGSPGGHQWRCTGFVPRGFPGNPRGVPRGVVHQGGSPGVVPQGWSPEGPAGKFPWGVPRGVHKGGSQGEAPRGGVSGGSHSGGSPGGFPRGDPRGGPPVGSTGGPRGGFTRQVPQGVTKEGISQGVPVCAHHWWYPGGYPQGKSNLGGSARGPQGGPGLVTRAGSPEGSLDMDPEGGSQGVPQGRPHGCPAVGFPRSGSSRRLKKNGPPGWSPRRGPRLFSRGGSPGRVLRGCQHSGPHGRPPGSPRFGLQVGFPRVRPPRGSPRGVPRDEPQVGSARGVPRGVHAGVFTRWVPHGGPKRWPTRRVPRGPPCLSTKEGPRCPPCGSTKEGPGVPPGGSLVGGHPGGYPRVFRRDGHQGWSPAGSHMMAPRGFPPGSSPGIPPVGSTCGSKRGFPRGSPRGVILVGSPGIYQGADKWMVSRRVGPRYLPQEVSLGLVPQGVKMGVPRVGPGWSARRSPMGFSNGIP